MSVDILSLDQESYSSCFTITICSLSFNPSVANLVLDKIFTVQKLTQRGLKESP